MKNKRVIILALFKASVMAVLVAFVFYNRLLGLIPGLFVAVYVFKLQKKSYEEKANNCRELMKSIEKAITAVDDGILSEILFQKYVLGRSLETISCAVNYSKRQIERLHLTALERINI